MKPKSIFSAMAIFYGYVCFSIVQATVAQAGFVYTIGERNYFGTISSENDKWYFIPCDGFAFEIKNGAVITFRTGLNCQAADSNTSEGTTVKASAPIWFGATPPCENPGGEYNPFKIEKLNEAYRQLLKVSIPDKDTWVEFNGAVPQGTTGYDIIGALTYNQTLQKTTLRELADRKWKPKLSGTMELTYQGLRTLSSKSQNVGDCDINGGSPGLNPWKNVIKDYLSANSTWNEQFYYDNSKLFLDLETFAKSHSVNIDSTFSDYADILIRSQLSDKLAPQAK